MSTPRFEAFLAALYVDADLRRHFLDEPGATATEAGLDASEIEALTRIDTIGLELAARSYAAKRVAQLPRERRTADRLLRVLRRSLRLQRP